MGKKKTSQGPPPSPAAPPGPPPRKKGARRKRAKQLTIFGILAGCILALLALDLRPVDGVTVAKYVRKGDRLVMDRLSAELGRVAQGEIVAVRERGKNPRTTLGRVAAVEGARVRGMRVRRGHVLVERSGKGRRARYRTVPIGDVMAIARLRIRDKGDRWAVDPLP